MERDNSILAKLIFKTIYNGILGALAILGVNFIGNPMGFHVAFNVVTVMTVGFLGIPGIGLVAVLQTVLK